MLNMKKTKLILFFGLVLISVFASYVTAQFLNDLGSPDLIAWWEFDGDATDRSGIAANGTVNNAVITNQGRFNDAYYFDGDGDYIDLGSLEVVDTDGNFTISTWINPAINYGSRQTIFSQGKSDSAVPILLFRILSNVDASPNQLQLFLRDGSSNTISVVYGSAFPSGWHHVAAVKIDNVINIYIDGINISGSGDAQIGSIYDQIWIGRDATLSNTNYFNGIIDDVRIYNRSLSAAEISDLYNGTTSRHVKFYGDPTEGLVDITEGVAEEGLVGLWHLDGNAKDDSGEGNDGTVNNALVTNEGRFNEAYYFDGNGDSITIGNMFFDYSINSITAGGWAKVIETGTPNRAFLSDRSGADNDPWMIRVQGGLFKISTVNETGSNQADIISPNSYNVGEWYHVMFSYNNETSELLLYENGILVANGTMNGHLESHGSINIGTYVTTNDWNGLIDEVRIYNRTLSADEIADLYNGTTSRHVKFYGDPTAGTVNETDGVTDEGLVGLWHLDGNAKDDSGEGNDGTVNNALVTNEGRFNEAYYFDGNGDYISIGDNDIYDLGTGNLSMCVWVKTNFTATTTHRIIHKESGLVYWGLGYTTENRYVFGIRDSTDGVSASAWGNYFNNEGDWNFICGVAERESITGIRIYENGQLISAEDATTESGSLDMDSTLFIGGQADQRWYQGTIDEVRIYDRVLSADEIADLYNGTRSTHMKFYGDPTSG